MKAKSKKNNLKRFFSVLIVVFILSLTLAVPCLAYNGSLIELNSNALVKGTVSNDSGVVSAIYFTTSQSSYFSIDLTILSRYNNINDYYSDFDNYNGTFPSGDSAYTSRLNAYFDSLSSSYNNGLLIGLTAGKNQMMDEIIQNANSNGTNISNQTYSPENLINVLNEIRNSAEYNGAFYQEDSDINYFINELIRLGVLAEPYDTFELTVDGNLENAKNIWFTEGVEESYEDFSQRLQNAYNSGYTQAGTDLDAFNESLITIFSSPYYIFNEVFDFEIFGISLASVLMFVLSILLVGFVIKLII